jgi:hypothetical protein
LFFKKQEKDTGCTPEFTLKKMGDGMMIFLVVLIFTVAIFRHARAGGHPISLL